MTTVQLRTTITLVALWLIVFTGTAQHRSMARQTGVANVNGLSIAYESMGPSQGEAILLIHGLGAQLIDWPLELCENLARKGYRVIRYDHRDVGLSSHLDSLGMPDWNAIIPAVGTCDDTKLPYSLTDMARDAVGLLTALHIEKAHLVGASMGGAVAQLIAIHFPDRTRSLTSLMASSGNPALPAGDPEVLKIMSTPALSTHNVDELARHMVRMYQAMEGPTLRTPEPRLLEIARNHVRRSWYPLGTARQAAAVIVGDHCDRRVQLKKITVPTVVIHGEQDPVVRVKAGQEVAASIPGAKLVIIPGMGHALPSSQIKKVCEGIMLAIRPL